MANLEGALIAGRRWFSPFRGFRISGQRKTKRRSASDLRIEAGYGWFPTRRACPPKLPEMNAVLAGGYAPWNPSYSTVCSSVRACRRSPAAQRHTSHISAP